MSVNEENKKASHAPQQEIKRTFGITNLSLANKTSVFILTILLALGGVFSYIMIPKESFPEIVFPQIFIGTPYPGNSPVDMENLVTRPIEKELKGLNGVKNITSTSAQDFSTIIVEFNPDVEIPKALQDVKDAVDKSKSELPNDLPNDPNVFELDVREFPIMAINIAGDYDMGTLKRYAEYLEDEIEKLSEVSGVDITGALDREVTINVDLFRMNSTGVSFSDIEQAVQGENMSISAGDVKIDGFRRSMRIEGEFKNPELLRDIIVKKEKEKVVYLRDIASVNFSYEEARSYARMNFKPVLSLQVKKRSGENLLDAADKIKVIIATAHKDVLPDDVEITITNDQSKQTRNQVANLENSIISGVILVVLVLLFFMGTRNALFVGMAIPLSMFTAFLILDNVGVTLNMIVLFSLILALGMLVDNGIVVIENIYRLMNQGYSAKQASKEGAGEVAVPIIASTLTTLVAFLPLAFWQGIIGKFMYYLPVTLIIVLSSSLFVALVINPVFTQQFMKKEEDISNKTSRKFWLITLGMIIVGALLFLTDLNFLGGLLIALSLMALINHFLFVRWSNSFQENMLPKIENFYQRQLRFALTSWRPFAFFGGTVVLMVVAMMLYFGSQPKVDLFPDNDPQYVNVNIELPVGTDIETTDSIARKIAERTKEILQPDSSVVEAILTNVGRGASSDMGMGGDNNTPNLARVTISFVDYDLRGDVSSSVLMEKVRNGIVGFPEAKVTVEKNQNGPPVGKPINLEIKGKNYDELIDISEDVISRINRENIPGIEELKMDLETQLPQVIVHIDREKVRRYGLSTSRIAMDLRTALFGKEVSQYKEGEDEFPIIIKLEDRYRHDLPSLMNQRITFRDQASGQVSSIPVSAVANISYSSTYGSVKRKDLDRVVTVWSNVKEGYNANEIVTRIKEVMGDYNMPAGYELSFTGEQEEMGESMAFLAKAMMIAIFLIFMILVTQFNSVIKPFIIMFSVIFSTIGVFLGLFFTQMDFVVIMTGIGIISLAGIVVNNAIVLIDYTDLIRDRRRKELGIAEDEHLSHNEFIDSVVQGGTVRLRPVLLTAITTVLGLIPLAIGLNIDFYGLLAHLRPNIYWGGDNAIFWGPMAWTVIFGLIVSTFLTLVIVPVMYVLSDKLAQLVNAPKEHPISPAEDASETPPADVAPSGA